jgi:hypothetical protein
MQAGWGLLLTAGDYFGIGCIAIYCQHQAQGLVEGAGLMRPL